MTANTDMNEFAIYTKPELRMMLRFYRRGPLGNRQCRAMCRAVITELRGRRYEHGL